MTMTTVTNKTPEETSMSILHAIFDAMIMAAENDDDERAHGYEYTLHQTALEMISEGAINYRQIAQFVLQSKEIKFARWCA